MHPQLRDEENLVIENAIRLAIDSIINVLYSVNATRGREYERMLGDRDKEIKRLCGREKDFERELRLLRRQGCACRLYDANDDEHCPGFADPLLQGHPECGDPGPGTGTGTGNGTCDDDDDDDVGDEMAAAAATAAAAAAAHGQLGLFDTSPSQVSTQSQDLVAPPPVIRAAFQQTSNTQEAIESLEGGQMLSNSPVIKKEPDLDAICESSDLHITTGMLGNEMLGEFRGNFYTGPDRLGPHEAEQHMRCPCLAKRKPLAVGSMLILTLQQERSTLLGEEKAGSDWSRRGAAAEAGGVARGLQALLRPQDGPPASPQTLPGQLLPLGATTSPCFLPASMTNNNINNINHLNNNSNRKRRKRILDLPEETQLSQREAWRAASKRYYARGRAGPHPDNVDLAHFLQSPQPSSGMNASQS
ncbi:hypothetical protein CRUP_028483 [Coryphaenoides rupestris]|nr:hypothetical protein CRUP_028483 [Coryphaenoides rupestris]